MKHPQSTEWMEYLYGEAGARQRLDLEAHLAVCPECQERVQRWRGTRSLLDAAAAPEVRPARPRLRHYRSRAWIGVAAGFLVLGFGIGRLGMVSERRLHQDWENRHAQWLSEERVERQAELQQALEATLRVLQEDQRAVLSEFARRNEVLRAADRHETALALGALDRRYTAETTWLRDELRDLASSTGDGFLTTREQVRLLSSYLPDPSGTLDEPSNPENSDSFEKTNQP